jgi:hypothetical protein
MERHLPGLGRKKRALGALIAGARVGAVRERHDELGHHRLPLWSGQADVQVGLPSAAASAIVAAMACVPSNGGAMGDKGQKQKDRGQKQKDAVKAGTVAAAKSKQDGYSRPQQPTFKGRK